MVNSIGTSSVIASNFACPANSIEKVLMDGQQKTFDMNVRMIAADKEAQASADNAANTQDILAQLLS